MSLVSLVSLASRQAGPAPGGDLRELVGFAAMAFAPVTAAAAIIFPVIGRIRILGIRRCCSRCFGGGSWPCCPQSDPDDLCLRRRQRMLGEHRGDDPDRILTVRGGPSWIHGR
jgi:hypothetical protein